MHTRLQQRGLGLGACFGHDTDCAESQGGGKGLEPVLQQAGSGACCCPVGARLLWSQCEPAVQGHPALQAAGSQKASPLWVRYA